MNFDTAADVEMICWQFRNSDYFRSKDRALIDALFGGCPPFTPEEAEENKTNVNVNFLEPVRAAHDGRNQIFNALMKPGLYFRGTYDGGPEHRREEISTIVTAAVNKYMKRSLSYFETKRSQYSLDVLHGIGPLAWEDDDAWCPVCLGVEDVYVPSQTLLTMRNLPFFALYKSFTARELIALTRNAPDNSGWNMELVESALKWIDEQSANLMGGNWPDLWVPEKIGERIKGDGAAYSTDRIPTIDCFDFYFWSEEGKTQGWRRRIIIDGWSVPTLASQAKTVSMDRRNGSVYDAARGQFLFTSGKRKVASELSNIMAWQFVDLSAVAPNHYHTIRSLGYLMYSVCHLQNRLRCRFTEKVFEDMMTLFRVKTEEDVQRVLQANYINQGFIDANIQIIPQAERFQFNVQLAELGLSENAKMIQANASTMAANPAAISDRTEKTKTQWLGEFSAMTSLISAGISQAAQYEEYEDREILRRFFRRGSKDHDVRKFRAEVLRKGVPEEALEVDAWEVRREVAMGNGNMSLQMGIADWLMQNREKFDPDPQRKILRDATFLMTNDAEKSNELVPVKRVQLTEAAHDAQLAFGTLMGGYSMGIESGINHVDYVETMLTEMAQVVERGQQSGMVDAKELTGLQAVAQHIAQHMAIIAQNPNEKQRVKQYGDALGRLMNQVKAFAQRLQKAMEAQQAAQGGNGQMDPKDKAKIQATLITAQTKAQLASKSHAERTAQKALTWQQQMEQRKAEGEMKLRQQQQQHAAELAATDLEAATNIRRNRMNITED